MSEQEMVARPATPNLDLLNVLTEEVYLPAGAEKLAAAGQVPANLAELGEALTIGMQVAQAVAQKKAADQSVTPLQAHAAKVASILGNEPGEEEINAVVNQRINQNPELAKKFAAALSPAEETA